VHETNHFHIIAVTIITAYFLYDGMVYFLFCGKFDGIMAQTLIHHFLGIFGIGASLFFGGVNCVVATSTLITEASTPFTNMRALMAIHDAPKKGFLFTFIGIGFTLSFFVVRVVYLGILMAIMIYGNYQLQPNYLKQPLYVYWTYFVFIGGYGLNLFWWAKIWHGFKKAILGGGNKKKIENKEK
jgi:hypothetical protein